MTDAPSAAPAPALARSRYWADWSTHDFAQRKAAGLLAQTIAVLPVAATEQHGPHLPLRVDSALVDGVVTASLAHLGAHVPALFLPTQTVGLSPEHARFAGTLTLKAETTIRLWTDIAESVAASGVKKLVLLNSHGGQVGVMDIVARDLRARLGMMVYSVNCWPAWWVRRADVNALFSAARHRFGITPGR
jgi:creatinine amidohydrolase